MANLITHIDEQDKRDFYDFCSSVGINASTAVNLFVKTVLREKRIPSYIIRRTPDPFFSKRNLDYVLKSVQELREGKGTIHELIEVDDD